MAKFLPKAETMCIFFSPKCAFFTFWLFLFFSFAFLNTNISRDIFRIFVEIKGNLWTFLPRTSCVCLSDWEQVKWHCPENWSATTVWRQLMETHNNFLDSYIAFVFFSLLNKSVTMWIQKKISKLIPPFSEVLKVIGQLIIVWLLVLCTCESVSWLFHNRFNK